MEKHTKIPTHVGIIMDGNGRWAQQRGLERIEGHAKGVESVRAAVRSSVKCGVKYLTLYAFSTENWGRPAAEVDGLMELFCQCVVSEVPELIEQGVKILMIGERERFSTKVQASLADAESRTAHCERLTLVLALNYSSRSEITMAVRKIAQKVASGELAASAVCEQTIAGELYTAAIPDPDLIIRTSGEQRLSNFLLWQASYAEFYFTPTLWPDFREEQLEEAIAYFGDRERRFGLVTK